MIAWLTPKRSRAVELLDGADLPPRELAGNLRDLRRANRYLGGLAAIEHHLQPWIEALPADRPVRVLDVATGGADVPLALATWAQRMGRRLTVVGLDHAAGVLGQARREVRSQRAVRLVQGDAGRLPFAPGSFDFALCSLTLHHLTPLEATRALGALATVAQRGLLVVDLERSWAGYVGTWLWSRACTTNRFTRHDGPLSVLRAYTLAELRALAAAAGLAHARIYRHPFFRLALVATTEPGAC